MDIEQSDIKLDYPQKSKSEYNCIGIICMRVHLNQIPGYIPLCCERVLRLVESQSLLPISREGGDNPCLGKTGSPCRRSRTSYPDDPAVNPVCRCSRYTGIPPA